MDLIATVRDQEADYNTLITAIESAESAIARLDPNLRPEAIRQRAAELRQSTEKMTADVRARLAQRAAEVEAAKRHFTPAGELRSARFHDNDVSNATLQLATFARLGKTPTPELLAHLEDAIERGNLAQVEAVRLEFNSRRDRKGIEHEWTALLDRVKYPKSEEASVAINRVLGLRGLGDERTLSLIRGHGDPVQRMTAARLVA